jgi:hypothetical protein
MSHESHGDDTAREKGKPHELTTFKCTYCYKYVDHYRRWWHLLACQSELFAAVKQSYSPIWASYVDAVQATSASFNEPAYSWPKVSRNPSTDLDQHRERRAYTLEGYSGQHKTLCSKLIALCPSNLHGIHSLKPRHYDIKKGTGLCQ